MPVLANRVTAVWPPDCAARRYVGESAKNIEKVFDEAKGQVA